jgi:hypothetical protein
MDEIKARAIANGTFMKAPNGEKSNLTERQWLQVRTKAFKNWFGDWENDPKNSSKVVDENGEPLVVYHGTIDKFSEFNKGYSKWYGETGIFFSSDRDYAESMSIFKALHKPIWRASEDDHFYNIPVFLNIKNPAQINDISNSTVGKYRKKLERHSSIDGVVGHDAYYEDDDLPRSKGVEYVAFNPN